MAEIGEGDDELLSRFFQEFGEEVPDGGFSRRVMRQLSGRSSRLNRAWTAVCLVLVAAFVCHSKPWRVLGGMAEGWLADISTHDWLFLTVPLSLYLLLLLMAILACVGMMTADRYLR